MPTKHCLFANCTSDSRYPQDGVFFVSFVKPTVDFKKCLKWIHASGNEKFGPENINKYSYICSKHFVGGKGPTAANPDPVAATALKNPKVRAVKKRSGTVDCQTLAKRQRVLACNEDNSEEELQGALCELDTDELSDQIEDHALSTANEKNAEETEQRVLFTCGLCEMICNEYVGHPCLEGCENVHLDENYYFYPVLDDGEIVRWKDISAKKGLCESGTFPNKASANANSLKWQQRSQKITDESRSALPNKRGNKLNETETELLIMEVQQRIPLWNMNIPIENRRREKVRRLWEEVSAALNGRLSATEAKIKFKSLRDTYRKIVQAEHRAGVSGKAVSQEQWKFYQSCHYLRDSCLIRPRSTNVSQQPMSSQQNCENTKSDDLDSSLDVDEGRDATVRDANVQFPGSTVKHKTRGRSRNDTANDSSEALNRIADALCRDDTPVTLPEPPKMDAIGAYLAGMGHQIRLLPQRVQMDIIKQFTDIIYNTSRQYISDGSEV